MKILLTIFTFIVLTNFAYGQEMMSSQIAAVSFEKNYNSDDYDAIYSSFTPELKTALSIEKNTAFLKKLKRDAGKIIKREFVKYDRAYASYKTTFERALFSVTISVDDNSKISGFFVRPYKEENLPKLERNRTALILPFNEEWTVIWGGDTKELNYHVESEAQKNAFDIVITDENGNSFKTEGKTNEDYYAFGKEIISPCDGEVVLVVDGVKDNIPGIFNPIYMPGNTVIIKTLNNEFLFFAHFKQRTIVVKEGQQIKLGQLLGYCGNSGNSSEPHLHFHIQNIEEMYSATGVKCYFNQIIVNGQTKINYSPIRKDRIRNEKK
jgi:murein DD-endopeptidase MepM/ murein hydrolase activator NlpD